MLVLVTGSTGFLGKYLCEALERDHKVIKVSSKNCDLRDQKSLEQFKHLRFDQIYHLAAWTQAGDFCLHHQGEQWVINQQINTNVLAWWKEYQPQAKMIAMGTSCAYDPNLPLEEDYYLLGKPIDSLFTYAMTKRMLLSGLMALNKQYNLQYAYFIPSTLYGSGYHTDGRQMHFIFDLARKILRAAEYGEDVILWGDGYQKRELIHVKDFVNIMIELSTSIQNEHLNVGAGKEHTIREFARMLCHYFDYNDQLIKYDTTKYVGAKSKILSIIKLQQYLPDLQITTLDQGLKELQQWFAQDYKNRRC